MWSEICYALNIATAGNVIYDFYLKQSDHIAGNCVSPHNRIDYLNVTFTAHVDKRMNNKTISLLNTRYSLAKNLTTPDCSQSSEDRPNTDWRREIIV